MAVKLVSEAGPELILNDSFRVEGLPLERDVPAVVIDGAESRHTLAGLVRTRPREVTISGHWWGTRAEADAGRRSLLRLARRQAVRIFADASDDRYLIARLREDGSEFPEGVAQQVIRARLVFVAHDPLWRSTTEQQGSQILTASGQQWSVTVAGSAPTYATIRITGAADAWRYTRKPVVENLTAGVTIGYDAELGDGEWVEATGEPVHPTARQNVIGPPWFLTVSGLMLRRHYGPWGPGDVDAFARMSDQWALRAFPLVPGQNVLEFRDDATGSHRATVDLTWVPRWF